MNTIDIHIVMWCSWMTTVPSLMTMLDRVWNWIGVQGSRWVNFSVWQSTHWSVGSAGSAGTIRERCTLCTLHLKGQCSSIVYMNEQEIELGKTNLKPPSSFYFWHWCYLHCKSMTLNIFHQTMLADLLHILGRLAITSSSTWYRCSWVVEFLEVLL